MTRYICQAVGHAQGQFVIDAHNEKYATKQATEFAALWMRGHAVTLREATEEDNPFEGYLTTRLPFEGFYNTIYSGIVDHAEEIWIEYEVSYRQDEDGIPEELQLASDDLWTIINKHSDYSAAYQDMAADYVSAFSLRASDEFDFKGDALGLHFESMDSPREYNFRTDRVYAYIHPLVLHYLVTRSAMDSHAKLRKVIKDNFTSRSGFSSHYDNALDTWLTNPFEEWDHNELCTLIEATIPCDTDEFRWGCYEYVDQDSQYWENCVDWTKVDADIAEWRADKVDELKTDEPDYEPPYRCDVTPDMFLSIGLS
jgi:hypothetical protein